MFFCGYLNTKKSAILQVKYSSFALSRSAIAHTLQPLSIPVQNVLPLYSFRSISSAPQAQTPTHPPQYPSPDAQPQLHDYTPFSDRPAASPTLPHHLPGLLGLHLMNYGYISEDICVHPTATQTATFSLNAGYGSTFSDARWGDARLKR